MKLADNGRSFFSDIEGLGRFLPHLTFFLPYGFKLAQSGADFTTFFFCIGSFWVVYSPPQFGFWLIFGEFHTYELYSLMLINWFTIALIPLVFNLVLIAVYKSYLKSIGLPETNSGPYINRTSKNLVWFVLFFVLVYVVTMSLTSAYVAIPAVPLIVLYLVLGINSSEDDQV
ncbi:MAG: hypothetical protein ACFFCP_11970 [Promethearchaeota archaeon]